MKKKLIPGRLIPAFADTLREGYNPGLFSGDLFAGITVGIVALPLAMAFAIASGVEPERGLITAVVAGMVISLTGGSRVQIGGPTGAFVVIVYDIVLRHGYEGLAAATLMAGLLLVVFGLAGFGRMIKFIPYPVTTGFTTGIAVIIFSSQVKDFFGMEMDTLPADFTGKWEAYFRSAGSVDPATVALAGSSLAVILLVKKFTPRIPGPLVAVAFAAAAVPLFGLEVETIGSRFGGIPSSIPAPSIPAFDATTLKELFPDALTIAFLAGIESLLSAVVADGMTGGRSKSDCELTAQGLANAASVVFGGIPATGAIARTATNVKNGGRTPVAGMVHAVTVMAFILLLAPLASAIPLCSLAAVLFVVAWNMSELNHFRHMFKAPASDSGVMVIVFALTLLTDLTVAVQTGVVLAALLFIKRMSDVSDAVTSSRLSEEENGTALGDDPDAISTEEIPEGMEVYEINGPFFFGVADRLKGILTNLSYPPRVFILRMRKVPVIDATAMHALEEFHIKCSEDGTVLVLSGVSEKLENALERTGIVKMVGRENIRRNIKDALARAREILKT